MSNRKKGCCGCLTALVVVFMTIGIIGSISGKEQGADKDLSVGVQTQTDDTSQTAEQQQEDPLLQEITAAINEKYDDCDVQQDFSSVTVKVWDNLISNTISTVQNNGGSANDAEWTRVKNSYLDTAKYIQGLVQNAGQDTPLNLSVLNNKNQNLVVLTFSNAELTYDILATESQPATSTAESAQAEQSTQPEQASQPVQSEQASQPVQSEQASQPDQSEQASQSTQSDISYSGKENNFNTYDSDKQQQTTDRFVLNKSTFKYHIPTCDSVKKIAPQNYATSNASQAELEAQGYTPCGQCFK